MWTKLRKWRRSVCDRGDPFVMQSKEKFIKRYRLPKQCTRDLLQKINRKLPSARDGRGCSIPPHMQFLTSLRCMASGSFQLSIADCLEMSVAPVCKYLAYVTRAIAALALESIQFPAPRNVADLWKNLSVAGMPGVIECIDCTHVPIRSPRGNDAERYRCRKGYFSINVQGICDPDLKFTNIIASWPCSAHESRIFDNSRICHLLEQGHNAGYLLGDSGYPCRKYLLTPILSPSNDKEKNMQKQEIPLSVLLMYLKGGLHVLDSHFTQN
ncbi:putative nuclease HARBI1 [Penaeus japonicus]|uniref:putative nuclease HARBI1 n=1 Tax=Penaeus japonicus TaxID=27405 RepID=UPI001C70BF0C|nr:putative nuclease HARBI1 [Penaeus japonicus]